MARKRHPPDPEARRKGWIQVNMGATRLQQAFSFLDHGRVDQALRHIATAGAEISRGLSMVISNEPNAVARANMTRVKGAVEQAIHLAVRKAQQDDMSGMEKVAEVGIELITKIIRKYGE